MADPGHDDTLAAPATTPAGSTCGLPPIDPANYTLGDEIARGGMGRIVEARDRRLDRPVAIKQLLGDEPDLRARFEREARITARLQHPAIVNILEAGTTPTGEPFYVMKLVRGESLDKAIAARPTLEARLGLVANVIAVVDALAYAHSLRVIHRDLKPGNVLVGSFGETVVIDWGLAKDLAAPDTSIDLSPARPNRADAGAGETIAGSIMGTPAYMPAEQALGDKVDERADVYALGAMLYHVLAGAPPYVGKTTDDILIGVIQGPPQPLAARQAGIPSDLVTIVGKAMAHDARQRYANAGELADDLKKFQTGQLVGAHRYSTWQLLRRFVRRHRTAFAIGAIGVMLLATLAIVSVRRIVEERERTDAQRVAAVEQRAIADAQRRAAEQSRGDAEDLMDFMMVELRDKLEPLGRLALLEPMVKKAMAYYAARGDGVSEADLGKRGQAHLNIGDVLRAEGDLTAALAEYRAALALRERLAVANPTVGQRQRELQIVLDKIGDILLAQQDQKGAVEVYTRSLGLAEQLAAADPSANNRRDVSVSNNKLGDVMLANGDRAGALARYQAALAIREQLARETPALAAQRDLSTSYDRIGEVHVERGELDDAVELYRKSLAIAERVAKDDNSAAHQRDLAMSHAQVGDVLVEKADLVGAMTSYRAALAIRQALVDGDPANLEWQRDLALSYDSLGDIMMIQHNTIGALGVYGASLALSRTLALRDPSNARWQRDLAYALSNVGDVAFERHELTTALADYAACREIREKLLAKDPASVSARRDVALVRQRQGRALAALGDPRALAEYTAALAIREALLADDPDNPRAQKAVAELRAALTRQSTAAPRSP